MKTISRRGFVGGVALLPALHFSAARAQAGVSPAEARAIANEAYTYGFPIVDNYRVQHAYWMDKTNPEYKGPWNQIWNSARLFSPADTAIQTPNSDTLYSFIGADLRSEPLVLTVPAMEKERYFSVQLIDYYTFNFDYIGTRTTGNEGGSFLLAGPGWKGDAPQGVKKVFRCETELAFPAYRTQLFNPDDLENVKKVQAGYKVQPLSAFLGQPAPMDAPAIDFIKPLTPAEEKTSPQFFNILNFVLQFCPTVPSEKELMARFAKLGVGAGNTFDASKFSPELKAAIEQGMADAWAALAGFKKELEGGEGMYPAYYVDATKQKLDGANRYTVHFAPGQLPPVNAFWSLTMYDEPQSLLVANPLNRYLINLPILPQLKRDADGGLTLIIQNESPGKDKEANWLPAPKGPFSMIMRLYWPKQAAVEGKWERPPLQRAT